MTDHKWDAWSRELEQLQKRHRDALGFYDNAFRGWTHGSGFKLPVDQWVKDKAAQLLAYSARKRRETTAPEAPKRIRRMRA